MVLDSATPQDVVLARALGALATPTRLALLRQLWTPRLLRDIVVKAPAPEDGAGAVRAVSRQTVREHLDRLIEAGLVVAWDTESEYGPTTEYSLNHQTIYALAEELRTLASIRPLEEPPSVTMRGAARSVQSGEFSGPCLVVVKGLEEGRRFDLTPPSGGRREWVIGRRRGLDVSLDFDPYVSTENAAVVWEAGAHQVVDLPESRNGTTLNFKPIEKGVPRALRNGDVLGVGRSLLLFRS